MRGLPVQRRCFRVFVDFDQQKFSRVTLFLEDIEAYHSSLLTACGGIRDGRLTERLNLVGSYCNEDVYYLHPLTQYDTGLPALAQS